MRNLCIFSAIAVHFLNGCSKEKDTNTLITKESVKRFIQIGPFISGTQRRINGNTGIIL
jgi:hypothetical protein